MGDDRHTPRRAHLSLETSEPMSIGSGFMTGLLSAVLGIAGVWRRSLSRFPQYLTYADCARFTRSPYLRAIIHLALVTSFLLGSVSAVLRANKALALDWHRLHAGGGAARRIARPGRGRRATRPGSGSTSSCSICCSTRPSSSRWSGCLRCAKISRSSGGSGSSTSPTFSSTRCSSRC